jgi:hypothetical protein
MNNLKEVLYKLVKKSDPINLSFSENDLMKFIQTTKGVLK